MTDMCSRNWLVPLALAILIPVSTRAQGFGLNEIGSCAEARGFANTSAPCKDASRIYWNPGATTELPGFSVYLGASAIRVAGGFTADTSRKKYNSNVPWAVPPSAFLNYANTIGDHHYALGFGYYIPYGLISQWRQGFPGDFESQRASLNSMYFQPNVAFELIPGHLSIGGGPVFGYSSVRLDQGQDLSTQFVQPGVTFGMLGIAPGTEFASATLKGTATAVGFNAGIHAQLSPTLQLGARYLSKLVFDYKNADATFSQVHTGLVLPTGNPLNSAINVNVDSILAPQFSAGALVPQKVNTKIAHPYQMQLGLGYTGIHQTTISVEWALIGYSAFSALALDFQGPAASSNRTLIEDYHDSWSIRTGLEHTFGDPDVGFVGRIGFSYVSTPAPDATVTPLLPDMNRYNYSVGFGYPLSRKTSIDFAYIHVGTEGRRGRTAERSTLENTDATAAQINDGFYNLAANVLSLSLKFGF